MIGMLRPARWLLPESASEDSEALAAELRIRLPAARVLVSRGFRSASAARDFLQPSLHGLHDPLLLRDMAAAINRLNAAIRSGEKILLYGDYDVDGATSVVILKKAIELAGGHASFHVPHRLKDGYGMRSEVIEQAANEGFGLIVSVDTGIRAADVVRHASGLGIDVIVTDHHLPEPELPPALAVINPNRPDCPYPNKNLCGAGVAFKIVQALLAGMPWTSDKLQRIIESFLKLVAVATIADVVPLAGENRVIVRHGLAGLRSVRNPGLRALLKVAGFNEGDSPTAGQVAFRLAPRINAAGRMADAQDAIDLFLTADDKRAAVLAEQLQALNQERQQTEAAMVEAILEQCEQTPVTDEQAALVFSAPDWHRGVVGIVASRLVERFCRPVFVLSQENGQCQGSGRSVPGFHLLEALESMPEVFTKFGGHRQAAGVSLPASRLCEFRERLNAYAAKLLKPDDFRPVLEVDALLELPEIGEQSVQEIFALAPFGNGNPVPLFAVLNAEMYGQPVIWKDKHMMMTLRQHGRTVVAKAWNFAGRVAEFKAGQRVDAAITLEEDPFFGGRGSTGWSAIVRDLRASS